MIGVTVLMTCMSLYVILLDTAEAKEAQAHPETEQARKYRLRHPYDAGVIPDAGVIRWLEIGTGLSLVAFALTIVQVWLRFRRASSDLEVTTDRGTIVVSSAPHHDLAAAASGLSTEADVDDNEEEDDDNEDDPGDEEPDDVPSEPTRSDWSIAQARRKREGDKLD